MDTVGDAEKYRIKLSEIFPGIKFVVAKKADGLFPVVSGASIVAKVIIPVYFEAPKQMLMQTFFHETRAGRHLISMHFNKQI